MGEDVLYWSIFVNLTQTHTIKELPPSEWPVGVSVERAILRQVGKDRIKMGSWSRLGEHASKWHSSTVPASAPAFGFLL